MSNTIDEVDVGTLFVDSAPVDITPEAALDEIQKRYDELTPLRARSQASLGLFLGSIHELEPVFESEGGREKLEKAVQEQPAVRKSKTYSTAKKSIIHLLLVKHMGLDSDASQRLGYDQALQAGHSQARVAETFAKWLKAAGGVSGAREIFRKLKRAGAFADGEGGKADRQPEESAVDKLAATHSVSGARELLPETVPATAGIAEGYFIIIGRAAKNDDGTLKTSTVGLWDQPAVVEGAAKVVDKDERAADRRRKKLFAETKKVAAYWKRKNKEGHTTGGATLVKFFETAEREAEELQHEEIKAIEATVQIDPGDEQESEQSTTEEIPVTTAE